MTMESYLHDHGQTDRLRTNCIYMHFPNMLIGVKNREYILRNILIEKTGSRFRYFFMLPVFQLNCVSFLFHIRNLNSV